MTARAKRRAKSAAAKTPESPARTDVNIGGASQYGGGRHSSCADCHY
jgi:hypothetical protein